MKEKLEEIRKLINNAAGAALLNPEKLLPSLSAARDLVDKLIKETERAEGTSK